MRECMRHDAGKLLPLARRSGAIAGRPARDESRCAIPWSALRSCRRAIPFPAACARGSRRRRAGRRTPRRGGACLRPSAPCAETFPGRRAVAPRTRSFQGQSGQAGRFGVHSVAPRSIIACAKSPARLVGRETFGVRADLRLRAGQGVFHREEPRDHALDIAVDRRGFSSERDRRDRGRGVGADAGQREQCLLRRREMLRHAARPPRGRRHAGCARVRSSQAPPRA